MKQTDPKTVDLQSRPYKEEKVGLDFVVDWVQKYHPELVASKSKIH